MSFLPAIAARLIPGIQTKPLPGFTQGTPFPIPNIAPPENYAQGQPMNTPGMLNVRVDEGHTAGGINIRDPASLYNSRNGKQQIAIMSGPGLHFGQWSAESFTLMRFGPSPHATMPLGTMATMGPQPNIVRTPSMAYGDLFNLEPDPYGLG